MTDTTTAPDDAADTAEATTEGADSAATGTEAPAEGKDTDPGDGDTDDKAAADAPKAFTKADGKPFTESDHTALTRSLAAARKEAKDHKRDLDALRAAAGGQSIDDVRAAAVAETEGTWRPRVVSIAARHALAEAGLALPEGRESEVMARALRLLDTDGLEIGDDGTVGGLSDQVAALRDDFPDLFAARRRPVARVDAADRGGQGGAKTLTATERQVAVLMGR